MQSTSTATLVGTQRPSDVWAAICRVFFDRVETPARRQALDAAALMERAAAYEPTQPSFAADLRAAASCVSAAE